jgi:hypothetical protein
VASDLAYKKNLKSTVPGGGLAMDPFAALGIAANIIQFIDFGSRIVSAFRSPLHSKDGMSEDISAVARDLSQVAEMQPKLSNSPLDEILEDTRRLAKELLEEVHTLQRKKPGLKVSKRFSFRLTPRKDNLEALAQQLNVSIRRLSVVLLRTMRYVPEFLSSSMKSGSISSLRTVH